MTDEGILFWCLNLRVTRDKVKGLLKLDQEQYVEEIFPVPGVDVRPISAPIFAMEAFPKTLDVLEGWRTWTSGD